MSWFGKWFTVTPVATQEDIDVLVNRLNQCETLLKLQERDIQALKVKVQMLLDRPIAQQIHNPNTYVGQVPVSLTSDRPSPYTSTYDSGANLANAMLVTASMVDLTDSYTEVSSSDSYDSSSSSSGD